LAFTWLIVVWTCLLFKTNTLDIVGGPVSESLVVDDTESPVGGPVTVISPVGGPVSQPMPSPSQKKTAVTNAAPITVATAESTTSVNAGVISDIDSMSSPPRVQAALEQLIGAEVAAVHQYLAQGHFFATKALNGYSALFYRIAQQHIVQVFKLLDYQRIRGNPVQFPTPKVFWANGMDALNDSLTAEENIYNVAARVNFVAGCENDPPTKDYLQQNEFKTQVELRRKFIDLVVLQDRIGTSENGEYFFDYDLINSTDPPYDMGGFFAPGKTNSAIFVSW